MRSFRTRILALVLGLVTVALAATVLAVVAKAREEVRGRAALELRSAADTTRQALKFRGRELADAAEVLTSDFGFKEAVASGDRDTARSAIQNHGARIGADLVILLDTDGALVAATVKDVSPGAVNRLKALIATDPDSATLLRFEVIDGRPYQVALAPVRAPENIAWTALGLALDDRLAGDLSRLVGVDVSFMATADDSPVFVASSLGSADHADIAALLTAPPAAPVPVTLGGDEFLSWVNPIVSNGARLSVGLHRSLRSALRPYAELRNSILVIGAVVLFAALALAALLARSATRPVESLTAAAQRLEAGDYEVSLPSTGTREFARLAAAFTAMRGAVRARERQILHQARHDPLTGLPNRARLTELLDVLIGGPRPTAGMVAVCLVDLQQFQDINGSLGHAAGDEALKEVGRRLADAVPAVERVARIAADQFAVLLENVSLDAAKRHAGQIVERLHAPLDFAGVSLNLQSRVGIAAFPDHGQTAADLLQRADMALNRAREGGTTVAVFVPGDDAVHRRRLALLGELRRAVEQDQLALHYQPKVSTSDGVVSGCEALLRWPHPVQGMIPPGDFIPHAERTGVIRILTGWVLRTALRQMRAWADAGLVIDVSVNLSAADLADPTLADQVADLLHETGADPSHLVLEVTESTAMRGLTNALSVMDRLRVLGVRFSIDDFGTGYSSLAQLRRLPVDELKIDRSFVHDLDAGSADEVIVRSTVELGHSLGLRVVAEGVESQMSLSALSGMGCDYIQGYFVSKPVPADAFAAWALDRRSRAEAGDGDKARRRSAG
jgi:diguanylate cyclase (GGDEF)-like protein